MSKFLAFVRQRTTHFTVGLLSLLAFSGVTSALLEVSVRKIEYNCQFLNDGISILEARAEFQHIQLTLQEDRLREQRARLEEMSDKQDGTDVHDLSKSIQQQEKAFQEQRSNLNEQRGIELPTLRTEQSVQCARGAELSAWVGFLNALFNMLLAFSLFYLSLRVAAAGSEINRRDD